MSTIAFSNNANSTLASQITNTATSITLAVGGGANFASPAVGQYSVVSLNDAATGTIYEIMHCTARTGDTLTVIRGQEGTSAVSWLSGDLVYSSPTAGQMSAFAQSDSAAFTNTPTAPTAPASTNTTQLATTAFVKSVLATYVYPVGSVYLAAVSTNPATLLGFGTWTAIAQGRAIVGVGTGTDINSNTATYAEGNDAQGEYVHTQTINELVSHDHVQNSATLYSTGSGTSGVTGNGINTIPGTVTQSTGGSVAFNVKQPAFGVYVWQRTA